MGEFSLIREHFMPDDVRDPDVMLEIGDDASLHHVPPGYHLAVSVDTALAGRHWPEDFPLQMAASRAMAAALSDLAAMGAAPRWAWTAVTLRNASEAKPIGRGLAETAKAYGVQITGGDTTAGLQTGIHITVAGLCPVNKAMTRSKLRLGHRVYLVGDVGLAAAGLQQWQRGEHDGALVPYFTDIKPLLKEGQELVALGVRSGLDVSDGLLQDAGHLVDNSPGMLRLDVEKIPSLAVLRQHVSPMDALRLALTGGEDYALLLTAPPELSLPSYAVCIGECLPAESGKPQVAAFCHGEPLLPFERNGFDHFA